MTFIDNIALVCALVKGLSSHTDLQAVVTAVHTALAGAGCSWYVEWVPSALNVADGPSREGLEDSWCHQMGIPVHVLPDCGYIRSKHCLAELASLTAR